MDQKYIFFSGCISLKEVGIPGNLLTSLDISNLPIGYINCCYNQISILNIEGCSDLYRLIIDANPIVENQIKLIALANSLPDRTGESTGELTIGNSTSAAWIQEICAAKNWKIF